MRVPQDDWRRMGQESVLPPGTRLVRRTYSPRGPAWDHDHCSFCLSKFASPEAAGTTETDVLTEGYTTTDEFERGADYEWVCSACFGDFFEEFGWVMETA